MQTDILAKQAENQSGDITKTEFREILEKYFNNVPEELPDDLTGLELTAKEEYGGQTIEIAEIWSGEFAEEKEYIETATSYVGYYADIDGNGSVDGIIYADLAVGGSGAWSGDSYSTYEYSAVTSGLKSYYVSPKGYEGIFGTKDVLAPEGNGADRFYVMALEDNNPGIRYCFYDAASGQLFNTGIPDNDFGQGKTNTEDVLSNWKTEEWGVQNDNGTYQDMWGEIEDEINEGWFVPSKSEWSAFGDLMSDLGLTIDDDKLSDGYWSSSLKGMSVCYADFTYRGIGDSLTDKDYCVRLSIMF